MALSQTRQRALQADRALVERFYDGACERFGAGEVAKDLSLVWMWVGMQRTKHAWINLAHGRNEPFSDTQVKNLKELLYVARQVCGLPRREEV